MSTPTPAERAITNQVDDAIAQYYQANATPTDSMPAGWVLLISDVGISNPDSSGIHLVYPNGAMPWATALGIIEMGRIQMHSHFAQDDD